MLKGIDVSSYQSTAFDTTGLDFVFTKVTEGLSYINPRWTQQRDHAKKAGLVWGAYHYPHMANDPKAEADYFLKQVKWAPGDIIVLDWEGYDSANQGVSKARQVAYRDAWLAYVKGKMPGHRVGMYCNTDYWRNVDTSANCGDFLWIATGGAPAGQPGISHAWTFHQYSTADNIDHDVANFASVADLKAWANPAAPKPTPAPRYEPYPGAAFFKAGKKSPIIAAMHKRLVAVGCNHYKTSTNTNVWGSGDVASYAAWQRKCGYSGADANGIPGKTTWDKLHVPNT